MPQQTLCLVHNFKILKLGQCPKLGHTTLFNILLATNMFNVHWFASIYRIYIPNRINGLYQWLDDPLTH